MVKQCLMGKYMAWLNVQLRKNDMRLMWQSEVTTEIMPQEVPGLADGGLSRDLAAHGTEGGLEVSVDAGTTKARSQQVEEVALVPITHKGLSQDLDVVESEEALRRKGRALGRGALRRISPRRARSRSPRRD